MDLTKLAVLKDLFEVERKTDYWAATYCPFADILSALRGPDDGDAMKKEATTAVIRREFFKRVGYNSAEIADMQWDFHMAIHEDEEILRDWRLHNMGDPETDHFLRHAKNAFQVLGLKWDQVNP
jgi:hypothetical protein